MSGLISRLKEIIEKYNAGCYNETCNPFESCTDCVLKQIREVIESQPPVDQWIPCSEPRKPANGQRVVVTTDLMKGMNYINIANYYTEKPKPWWEDEWDGEGFYQSHECGYCRREDVTAWFFVEPYKGE